MSDPTPETTSNISRLRLSRIKAIGTLKTPRMSIQANSGAEMSMRTKMKQLQKKLPRTAAIEIKPLMFFQRRVNKVMTAAEASGSSKTNHGRKLFVVNFKILELRCLRRWLSGANERARQRSQVRRPLRPRPR